MTRGDTLYCSFITLDMISDDSDADKNFSATEKAALINNFDQSIQDNPGKEIKPTHDFLVLCANIKFSDIIGFLPPQLIHPAITARLKMEREIKKSLGLILKTTGVSIDYILKFVLIADGLNWKKSKSKDSRKYLMPCLI